jgi:hypothetical protein
MTMKIQLLPLLALLAACAHSTATPWSARELRAAEDTPTAFVTEDGEHPEQGWCRNPLIDPRDQTRLRLVRSAAFGDSQRGDYEVPQGRYGVGPRELLRIECATGQALGIVQS